MTHSPGPTQCVLDCAGMLRTLVTLLHHDVSHCESNLHVSRMPRCEQGGHKGQGPRTTTHGHNQSAGRPVFVGHEMGPCQPASFGTTTTQPQCTSLVLCLRVESTEKLQDERRPHQRRLHPSNEKEQSTTTRCWLLVPWVSPNLPGSFGTSPLPEEAVSMAPKRKGATCSLSFCPPPSPGIPVWSSSPHRKDLVPCSLPSRSARALGGTAWRVERGRVVPEPLHLPPASNPTALHSPPPTGRSLSLTLYQYFLRPGRSSHPIIAL